MSRIPTVSRLPCLLPTPKVQPAIRSIAEEPIISTVPKHALRRRSKSTVDMRPRTRPFQKPMALGLSKASNIAKENLKPLQAQKQALPAAPKAVGGQRPLLGQKRAAPVTSNGETKAKKCKVPAWDYKTKFHNLQEEHRVLVEKYDRAKSSILECETMRQHVAVLETQLDSKTTEYNQSQIEISRFHKENTDLKAEICDLRLKSATLQLKIESLEAQLARLNDVEAKLKLCEENNKNLDNDLRESRNQGLLLKRSLEETTKDLQTSNLLRRALHNTIQDLKGNIRVFCRVRPPIDVDELDKLQCIIDYPTDSILEIKKSRESINPVTRKCGDLKLEFNFDRVFGPDIDQEEVFEELSQLVQSALDGYNVCVFAYGQTGSGKTYTMMGNTNNLGMIPRTIDLIFASIKQMERLNWTYTIEASFLEIYNESIRDLLQYDSGVTHDIKYNEGRGVTVTNLMISPVKSANELRDLMAKANRNRFVAATNYNEHSSRSHAVTKIYIRGTHKTNNIVYESSINLVDLAGSESARTSVTERLTETKNINKSLSILGSVMAALHTRESHIPYRNSKLTFLLQSCLGGNSKTLMFVNMAPFEECYGESVNSLRFASMVKEVKTVSKKNRVPPK